MSAREGGIEVIVTRPGAKVVLVVDRATGRLLLYTTTYNRRVKPGRYSDPDKVVRLFKYLATRGHETVRDSLNVAAAFEVLEQILKANLAFEDKLREVKRYLRSQRVV